MITSYFMGYDNRQEYVGTLTAASFFAGFLAFLIYGQWDRLPGDLSEVMSGEHLPLLLCILLLGGAAMLAITAAFVRRARDAEFPVSVPLLLLGALVPLVFLAFADPPRDRVYVVTIYGVLLLDLMLLVLLALLLALVERLNVSEEAVPLQPALPAVERKGFAALKGQAAEAETSHRSYLA